MRFYEVTLLILELIVLVIIQGNKHLNRRKRFIITLSLLALFILHLLFENLRWQMVGSYYLLVVLIINLFYKIKTNWLKKFVFIINILMIILSFLLIFIFRANHLIKPNGSYQVGTLTYELIDDNRKEIYGSNHEIARKIKVQAWYPSDETNGKKSKWIGDGKFVADQLANYARIPKFLLTYITNFDSNSYENTKLTDKIDKLPVVIISHGWSSFRSIHTDFAEMLASNGFLVLAIDHTYGAMGTVFEDGSQVAIDLNALPDSKSLKSNYEFLQYANTLVNTYYLDSKLVLDNISKLNDGESNIKKFISRIDTDKIGVLGHSTGGGGLSKLAITDDRIKSIIGLDPWVEPIQSEIVTKGLKIPSLFFRSQQWSKGPNNINLKKIFENSSNNLDVYQIKGSIHQDFTMLYLFNPIGKYLGLSGNVENDLNREVQLTSILNFFNKTLKGKNINYNNILGDYDIVAKIIF